MSSRNYAVKAETRERAGKGVARELRRQNKVPAVVYGDGKEPVKISIESKEINIEYNKGHMLTSLCDLEIAGKQQQVLARDVQLHPVTDRVEHVDFLRVNAKTKIAVMVPVHFINEADCPGLIADKGVLGVVRHDVELVCLATDIPDHVNVDLTGRQIGDALRINDAALPQGTRPADQSRNFILATLQAPKQFIEEAPAAAEGAEGEAAAAGAEGAAPAAGAAAAPAKDAKAAAAPAKEEKKK